MIRAQHLEEAQARLDELTNLTGFVPGSDDWLDEVLRDLGGPIAAAELQEFCLRVAMRSGPEAYAREWVRIAAMSGVLIAIYARGFAERDGELEMRQTADVERFIHEAKYGTGRAA